MLSKFGTHKAVNARFWPWLEPSSGQNERNRVVPYSLGSGLLKVFENVVSERVRDEGLGIHLRVQGFGVKGLVFRIRV